MSMTKQLEIVPFGKYKNQPVEVLAADKAYCEWLVGQDWLRERFPSVHTLIINHFGETEETPEHNKLQLRFLDEMFRVQTGMLAILKRYKKLFTQFRRNERREYSMYGPIYSVDSPIFEFKGMDVVYDILFWSQFAHICDGYYCCREKEGKRSIGSWNRVCMKILVECKPSLGDEYPAVMRQIISSKNNIPFSEERVTVLLIENFTATGGTLKQVTSFFESSGIYLVRLEDYLQLPEFPFVLQSDTFPSIVLP